MCRLFAISSKKPVKLDKKYLNFLSLSKKHNDGWGLAWFNKEGLGLVKEPIPAYKSQTSRRVYNCISSRIFLGHLRKAWVGKNKFVNTHPFVYKLGDKEWVFAHNGTLYKKDEDYGKRLFKVNVQGETDSERFFTYVMEQLKLKGEHKLKEIILENIKQILAYQDYSVPNKNGGLNFILTDGQKMYVHRKNRTLWYLQEKGNITICSQPLTKDDWQEFEEDVLYLVRDGEYEIC